MKALRSAMQKQRSGVLSRIATLCGLLFGANTALRLLHTWITP
jgi:hypothetical protein